LLIEHGRPAGAGVRPLPGERGRHGAGARNDGTAVRRLPDVLAGWPAPGVGLEPQREGARRDEHLCGRLGRVSYPSFGPFRESPGWLAPLRLNWRTTSATVEWTAFAAGEGEVASHHHHRRALLGLGLIAALSTGSAVVAQPLDVEGLRGQ